MTLEEINELEKELDKLFKETKEKIQRIKEEYEETKQHKSLSDYRCYEELRIGKGFKNISSCNEALARTWQGGDYENAQLSIGNIYSIDTPDELLEREVKKRQLWFALEKHLKEKGCLATNEDWETRDINKYYIYYDYEKSDYSYCYNWSNKYNTIYSTDEKTLKEYMNNLSQEDIKIMFDVE